MRALFPSVLVSSILITPFAYGNSIQPAPPGSIPSDNAIILRPAASADTRSSYIVDRKGFYELGAAFATGASQVGSFTADDDAGTKGSSLTGGSSDALNLKSVNSGTGIFSGNAGSSLFSSSGAGGSSSGGPSSASGLFGFKGLGEGPDLVGGKGLGLLLSNSETDGLGLGSAGPRDPSSSVSTTPLPASWVMMLTGLLAFGVFAFFRRPKMSASPPSRVAPVTE